MHHRGLHTFLGLLTGHFFLIGFFFVSGFLYGFGAKDPAMVPKYLGFDVLAGCTAMLLMAWAVLVRKPRSFSIGWPLLLLFFLLLSYTTGLLAAPFPQEGLPLLLKEPVWMFLCFVFATLCHRQPEWLHWAGRYAAIAGVLLVAWGAIELLFAMDGAVLTHQSTYEMRLSFAHRNIYVQYICLLACFQLNALNDRILWKYLRIFSLLVIAAMAAVSLCRTGWVAMSVIFAFLAFQVFKQYRWKSWLRAHWWVPTLYFSVVILGMVLLIDEFYTFVWHIKTALDFTEGTTSDRLHMVGRSLQLFWNGPLTGCGAGNWKVAFMQFDQSGLLTDNATLFYQRPHNDFAWLLAEFGIGAGALFTALFVIMPLRLFTFRKFATMQGLAFIGGFIIVALTSFPRERMELQAMLIFPIAIWQVNEWRAGKGRALMLSTPFQLGGLALVMVVLSWITCQHWEQLQVEQKLQTAMLHRDSGKWPASLEALKSIPPAEKVFDHTSTPIDWYEGLALLNLGDMEAACAAFSSAMSQNPHHPHVLNNVAYCRMYAGDTAGAMELYKEAVRNFTRFTEGWVNIATIHYSRYELEEAYAAIRNADIESDNTMYKTLTTRLAAYKINNYLETAPKDGLFKTIEAMRNTPNWSRHVLRNSVANNNSIEEQIVIDAIYYREKNCESDCDDLALLKKHYHVQD